MRNTYILTNSNIKGSIVLEFFKGHLNTVRMELKEPFNADQFKKFFSNIPRFEEDLVIYQDLGLKVTRDGEPQRMGANEKVALFCTYYKKYKEGLSYKATGREANMIKEYKINDAILEAYFNSQLFDIRGKEGSKGKHGIPNLIANYNQLIAEMSLSPASKFPNYWSKDQEAKYKGKDVFDYWKHLTAIGLKAKKDRTGNVIEWIKAELL